MGGSWLPADFNLSAFELFAAITGSAEWLALEHPVALVLATGILTGWKLRNRLPA